MPKYDKDTDRHYLEDGDKVKTDTRELEWRDGHFAGITLEDCSLRIKHEEKHYELLYDFDQPEGSQAPAKAYYMVKPELEVPRKVIKK